MAHPTITVVSIAIGKSTEFEASRLDSSVLMAPSLFVHLEDADAVEAVANQMLAWVEAQRKAALQVAS